MAAHRRGAGPRGLVVGAPLALLCLVLLPGCNDSGTHTTNITNSGLDCGLVHNDLIGSWHVTISAGTRTLLNCTGTGASGATVTSSGSTMTYSNVTVVAQTTASLPLGGVGYQVVGSGVNRPDELISNVEAASCLAQFQVWENADKTYVQCIGTFDIPARSIVGSCDSAESDSDGNGTIDTFCDLSATFNGDVQITTP